MRGDGWRKKGWGGKIELDFQQNISTPEGFGLSNTTSDYPNAITWHQQRLKPYRGRENESFICSSLLLCGIQIIENVSHQFPDKVPLSRPLSHDSLISL